MANDADDVSVDGESAPRRLGKIKSKASVDTNASRGSRDEDSHDSDGRSLRSGGALSKIFRRHKKSKSTRGADGHDADSQEPGQQRGRSPYTINRSVATLEQPSTPGEHSSQLTSDEEETDDEALPAPPPLTSRQSHKEYLVATSPRVASNTVSITGGSSQTQSHTRSNTVANDHFNFEPKPAPGLQHGWTMAGKLGVESPGRDKSRSISPGARIKDVFKGHNRRTSPSKDGAGDRESRPGTRDGYEPISQRPSTRGSTTSLPMSITSNGTESSIPPVPPIPSSPPQIALNGAGLGSKSSLSSVVLSSGDPGRTPVLTATPPTPVLGTDESAPRTPPVKSSKPSTASPPLSAHRRTRSDSASKMPSKLSQSMSSPLTPTAEEPPGSRGRNVSGGSAGSGAGFFTSVFSAAQNMGTTLANMGGNSNRPRGLTTGSGNESIPEKREEAEAETTHGGAGKEVTEEDAPKLLAIDTMGSGNLSLSHLGITTESTQAMSAPNSGLRSRSGTQVRHEEHSAKMEDASAAEAVSAAYSSPTAANGLDRPATAVAEDTTLGLERPPSQAGSLIAPTPPQGSIYEGDNGIRRTGSIREKLADRKRKKHRNSSGATIGAALAASTSALTSPGQNSVGAKLDGFTYANRKRDKEYHQLFRSVPEDDHLLEDYSCALQRDIILAGRIYVSEGHICFSSNILGWVTNLIISFDEIVAIEKESTAMVFPNAIAIQTLHARHTFRSLLSREATYDLMIGIWKTNHPNLATTETGTKLLSGADAIAAENAEDDSGDEDEDESEDGSDNDDDDGESLESRPGSRSPSVNTAAPASPQRKASQMAQDAATATSVGPTVGESKAATAAAGAAATAEKDYPGPATHAPTECNDGATHFENLLKDDVIPAPLGKVYSMMFGPASGGFMSRWLLDEAKCWDLEVTGGGQLKAIDNDNKVRNFSYMKPLYGAIGPKQTKCIVKEEVDAFDLDKAVSVTVTTQTPDVPSGNVFASKTRYCLSWGPNNGTKFHMSFFTEWSGKSWIKGPIEKGSKDGQLSYADDITKALKAGVTTGSRARAGSKGKKGKRGKKGDVASGNDVGPAQAKGRPARHEDNWGLLDPLRPILAPVVDPIKPLFSARSMCGFLLFLLIVTWFRNSKVRAVKRQADAAAAQHWSSSPATYDKVWHSEEDALWKWLEERVGMKNGVPVTNDDKTNADASKTARKARQQVLRGQTHTDDMSVREIEYALRVTKEKLGKLERAVGLHSGDEGEETKDA